MPVVKNTSQEVFQDGDLIIRPGEAVDVHEDRATILLRDYAWQFEAGSDKAPTEEEIRVETRNFERPVLPINPSQTVEVERPTEQTQAKRNSK